MKKIFFIITLIAAVGLTSCQQDTVGVSKVTTYATLTLKDGSPVFWPLNTPFVDPTIYTAMEGDKDITDKVVISGSVNAQKGGAYTLTYKAQNSDGFWASTSRTVYVYDTSAPLNGFFSSTIVRNNNGTVGKRGPFSILVFGIGNDQYWIEDLLGGWYYIGSNYGVAYAGRGIIQMNADNTISVVSAVALPWGYPCKFYDTSTFDLSTNTINLKVIMADQVKMLFDVTLSNPTPLK